jgi:amidohydrolase
VLAELGLEVQTGVGKTGVVGYMGKGEGPVVRCVPIWTPCLFRKKMTWNTPHRCQAACACGHDAHTAMLLGAATLLSRQELPGQVASFSAFEEASDAEGVSGAAYDCRRRPGRCRCGHRSHVDGTLETGHISAADGGSVPPWIRLERTSLAAEGTGHTHTRLLIPSGLPHTYSTPYMPCLPGA